MDVEMARECGTCTVCCTVTKVPELNKPENVTCKYVCGVGSGCTGCSIYKDRPQSCRNFKCLWLQTPEMDDNLRPDKSGVMFESIPGKRTVVATVDPWRHEVGKDPQITEAIDQLVKQDRPVIVTSAGHPHPLTILPDGWTMEQAWSGVKT